MSIVSASRSHSLPQRNARHRNSRRLYLSRVQPFVETDGRDIEGSSAETAGCSSPWPLTYGRILTPAIDRSPAFVFQPAGREEPEPDGESSRPDQTPDYNFVSSFLTLRAYASHAVECHLPLLRPIDPPLGV